MSSARVFTAKVKLLVGVGALAPLLITTGLFRAGENAMQTSFAPFGHEVLHITTSVIGLVVTISGIVMVLSNLLLTSKIRAEKLPALLVMGLGLLSLSFVLLSISDSVVLYLISSIFLGISSGLCMPLLSTMAGRLKGISRDRALTAFTVALSGSLAIGPAIESGILKFEGGSFRTTLLLLVPFGLASAAFAISIFRGGEVQFLHQSSSGQGSPAPSLRGNLQLRLAIIGQLINQIPFIAFITFGVLVAHSNYHVSTSSAQLIFTTFFSVSFVIRVYLVIRPQTHRTYGLLKVCAVLMVVAILALALGNRKAELFIIVAILGIPHGLLFPLTISLVARGVDPRSLSKANASLFTSISMVSVFFPLVLGIVIAHFGYGVALELVAASTAFLAILLWATSKKLSLTSPSYH